MASQGGLAGGEPGSGRRPTVIHGPEHVTGLSLSLVTALAEEPRLVVCDLRRTNITADEALQVFTPVVGYLLDWPGTGVVVVCADPQVRKGLRALPRTRALLVRDSADSAIGELDRRLPELDRARLHLTGRLTAPRAARRFVARALLDWRLAPLVGPAALVVSELVTNSVVHAASTVDLSVTRANRRVQVAVHDHGVGHPQLQDDVPAHYLGGRGLLLVREFTRCWGVFPASPEGKMVWAVLDAAA